jgi:hypothetical protein
MTEQPALLWMKYWDLHDENSLMKLMVQEKDETIARSKIAIRHKRTSLRPKGSLQAVQLCSC